MKKIIPAAVLVILSIALISNWGSLTGKNISQINQNGQPAPNFTLKNTEGKNVSLSDFKGKVVYMDIWASWCGPCIAEMPHGKKIKEQYKDNKNIVFLYVSIDSDHDRWLDMISKKKIEGIHVRSHKGEEEGILQKYNVPSIPRFVLIDKQGKIADFYAKAPSEAGLTNDIEKLLTK